MDRQFKNKRTLFYSRRKQMTAFILAMAAVCLLAGCRRKKKDERSSLGVDDGIGGFLFNFDEREEVDVLVNAAKKGQYPGRVTWYYEPGSTSREGDSEVESRSAVSEDPELIEELYYALGNTIIVGISNNQSEFTHYYVSFDLGDGQECRYDFVSENTVRLSGQNYVIETDGSLWRSLVMPDEAITEEGEEPGEAVTEGALEEAESVTEGALEEADPAAEAVTEGTPKEAEPATEAVTEGALEEAELATEAVTEGALEEAEPTTEAVTEGAGEETESVTEGVSEVSESIRIY